MFTKNGKLGGRTQKCSFFTAFLLKSPYSYILIGILETQKSPFYGQKSPVYRDLSFISFAPKRKAARSYTWRSHVAGIASYVRIIRAMPYRAGVAKNDLLCLRSYCPDYGFDELFTNHSVPQALTAAFFIPGPESDHRYLCFTVFPQACPYP